MKIPTLEHIRTH